MSSWPWLGADQLRRRLAASSSVSARSSNETSHASSSSLLLGSTASAMNIPYAARLQQAERASLPPPPPPPPPPVTVTASLPYAPDVLASLVATNAMWNAQHGILLNNHSLLNSVRDHRQSSLESSLLRELEICRSQQLLLQQSSLLSANPASQADSSLSLPAKLFALLSTPELEHIVAWMPHGKAWKIRDLSIFVEQILPLFGVFGSYPIRSIDSFIRTLKRWGFKQFLKGPDVSAYYHEMFIRDYPALHTFMRPCTSYEHRALHSPANEPDFYRNDVKNRSPSLEKLVASLVHMPSFANGAIPVPPAQNCLSGHHSTAPPGLTGSAWSEPNLPSLVHARPPPLSASANHSPTGLSSLKAHAELVRALLKSGHAGVEQDTSQILAERMSLLSNVDDFKLGMTARDTQATRYNDESKPPAEGTSPTSTSPSTLISSSLGKAITMTQFQQQQMSHETHIVQDDETNDQRMEFTLENAKRIAELADKKKKQTEQDEVPNKSLQVEELESTPAAIPQEKIESKTPVQTAPPITVKTPVAKKKKTPKKKSTSDRAISAAATKSRRKWLPKLGPPPAPEEESDSKDASVDIKWYFTNPELFAAISEKTLK